MIADLPHIMEVPEEKGSKSNKSGAIVPDDECIRLNEESMKKFYEKRRREQEMAQEKEEINLTEILK